MNRDHVLALVKAVDAILGPADAQRRRGEWPALGVEIEVRAIVDRRPTRLVSRDYCPLGWVIELDHETTEFGFASAEEVADRFAAVAADHHAIECERIEPPHWLMVTAQQVRDGDPEYTPARIAGLLEDLARDLAEKEVEKRKLGAALRRKRAKA